MEIPERISENGTEYIRKDIVDDMLATAEDHAYFAGSENAREKSKEEIIHRIREEIDKIYEKYEGNPLIEKEDIMFGFENIINDYYEEQSIM